MTANNGSEHTTIKSSPCQKALPTRLLPLIHHEIPATHVCTAMPPIQFIQAALEKEARFPMLEKAHRSPSRGAKRELEAIIRELFHRTSQRWLALKLLERCAADWPQLAELWFGNHRLRLLWQLAQYLDRRMAERKLRKAPMPRLPRA